ncbi:putative bifunctional diguanylate cyclase/phosphodiesterase [Sporosarcina koreensis]|uniref:putative bifunctional diguanylate cyclase/phosphodiesterase n=1 Tax=Sporosarcina koreensis TaxID=334735 RepID=UPI00058B84C9|nr:GGDEF and EAL domain-containing protein [Sporosarcina koreensis]
MERSREEMTEFVRKIKRQQQEVFRQAKQLKLDKDSMTDVLLDLCGSIAGIMGADRVSIWLFSEDYTYLTEKITFAGDTIKVPKVRTLYKGDADAYFTAIAEQRVRPVEDIAADTALQSLPENYFADSPMASLIDASIIMSRGIGGVLCCETQERRKWSELDEVIMAAVADMLSFVFDRLSQLEMEHTVHELAYTDTVTGIDNENAFIEKVDGIMQRSGSGMQGAFLYMKADQFTTIQSVLGPDATKHILKEIAERFVRYFLEDAVIARIAFDHFIIFTEYHADEQTRQQQMEKIMSRMREPIQAEGQEVHLTFSYGVAFYPEHITTAYEGIQAAKIALDSYQPNTARKSRAVYDPEMSERWQEAMHSEMNLGKALERNEFRLYYQPQVESVTHRMTGAEALIRWQHPERGIIPPVEFIGIAETTGLIVQIGEWVICEACRQLCRWKELGLDDLTISVNISPRHFLHRTFPDFIDSCLEEFRISPESLIIEITENVAFESSDAVEQQIQRLTDRGFSISIDDFGTGYSAFIYLQKFAIQEVKIDRQFVRNIDTDVRSRAIVRAILTLAKSLHMHTVAEGVETEAQLRCLETLGFFEIQGYYFGRPVPAEELTDRLLASPRFPQLFLPIPAT